MDYQQTLNYLYNQLPMFQRIGAAAFKKDLTNTIKLMDMLHHPEQRFRSIHIAGTNGKGSVTHMIAAVLQAAGYKVGVYSSPHLKDFRERMKINGAYISEENVIDFVEKYNEQFEPIQPSFFELTVAMAFQYFAEEHVDVAVIETGMGGRLDSTNVITPLLSVITNISLEHQQFLGDTLPKIAGEKAGIIKEYIPVVIGEALPETEDVFILKANSSHAPIYFADKTLKANILRQDIDKIIVNVFHGENILNEKLEIQSGATYQVKNTITTLMAVQLLKKHFNIADKDIFKGFSKYKTITNFLGRWTILENNPLILADTAHNPAGLELVFEQISRFTFDQKHLVIGMVSDKDVEKSLIVLPEDAIYYFCKPDVPRGLDANELSKRAAKVNRQGVAYGSVTLALKAARNLANKNDLIYIGGSTFVVGEII